MAVRALKIRSFREADTSAAVALWRECGLVRPWNDPYKDIERKGHCQPELFLVGTLPADGQGADVLVATAMAGYDGHRGSVYYLAVAPGHQQMAIGRTLMEGVEHPLAGARLSQIQRARAHQQRHCAQLLRQVGLCAGRCVLVRQVSDS